VETDRIRGTASWYGEEFAGRTTANGEIFDPNSLTAAHRTLPFGTVLDVTNPANGKSVRVRINDRGPFVGDRILDLSYAAAAALDMVNAGIAPIDARVVEMGRGDRSAPAPYVVTITPPAERIGPPPDVAFPLPGGREAPPEAAPASEDDVVEDVLVIEERAGQRVRKRVAADGVTIESVTEDGTVIAREAPTVAAKRAPRPPAAAPTPGDRFVVQLGAFGVQENAEKLRAQAAAANQTVYVELRAGLWRVRVGPFATRQAADDAAARLAGAGYPGIVLRAE
jgi:rare lipoprotein A